MNDNGIKHFIEQFPESERHSVEELVDKYKYNTNLLFQYLTPGALSVWDFDEYSCVLQYCYYCQNKLGMENAQRIQELYHIRTDSISTLENLIKFIDELLEYYGDKKDFKVVIITSDDNFLGELGVPGGIAVIYNE